jgi:hypothetical protein
MLTPFRWVALIHINARRLFRVGTAVSMVAGALSGPVMQDAFPGLSLGSPIRPSLVIEPSHALVAQLDRASDFESEGREFESLRARHHLGLQIKGFLQFRLRSFAFFRVAKPCRPITMKSVGYRWLPFTPRNTGATRRFLACSSCGRVR